jgi:hypothetical protein
LTLNLTGVRLSKVRTSDLAPSALRRNLYQANAHIVRYYDNLRVVYELESRVREMQRLSDSQSSTPRDSPSAPEEATPEKRAAPRSGAGSSRRQTEPVRQDFAARLEEATPRLLKGATV